MARDPLIGRHFGSVRITAHLGSGAMGTVYRAWHDRFACEVAVKLLKTGAGGNYRERFLREGRAAAKVRHPNVVQVMDAGEVDGTAYLVLELVHGHSLGALLDGLKAKDGIGAMEIDVVRRLGAEMARGMAAIHAAGIVHRDIKPDNVLIGADGQAKISDLGLAKQLDDPELLRLTGTGMVVGTPLYISPEGIRDPRRIGPPSDVYALGITLYQMLAGDPPFGGKSAYDVMRGHLEARPAPIRLRRPEAPAGLVALVERCLAKEPGQRPTAAEIGAILAGGRDLRGGRLRSLAAAAAVAAVAVGALGAGAWWWLSPRMPGGAAAAAAGAIAVRANLGGLPLAYRLGDGDWLPLPADGTVPASGRQRLAVRADRPGRMLAFQTEVEVAPGAAVEVPAVLAPVAVPPVAAPVSGGGLLFRSGVPIGGDRAATLSWAGIWHLGRTDGRVWTTRLVRIGLDGAAELGAEEVAERIAGPAFFRDQDDAGQARPPHLVVPWWLAEAARAERRLAEPRDWAAAGLRPEQPAAMPVAILDAVVARTPGARLADRAAAAGLAVLYGARTLWCRDGNGRPDQIGQPQAQAVAILVPDP